MTNTHIHCTPLTLGAPSHISHCTHPLLTPTLHTHTHPSHCTPSHCTPTLHMPTLHTPTLHTLCAHTPTHTAHTHSSLTHCTPSHCTYPHCTCPHCTPSHCTHPHCTLCAHTHTHMPTLHTPLTHSHSHPHRQKVTLWQHADELEQEQVAMGTWINDKAVTECMACSTTFTMFHRKVSTLERMFACFLYMQQYCLRNVHVTIPCSSDAYFDCNAAFEAP